MVELAMQWRLAGTLRCVYIIHMYILDYYYETWCYLSIIMQYLSYVTNIHISPLQIAEALWWYYFSKFVEFFDTVSDGVCTCSTRELIKVVCMVFS